jgi:large subunit ribosomal protein L32
MAVPKKKTSKSKRNMRRGSNGTYSFDIPNVVVDETTGEYKLSHHISIDGYYKGRKIIEDKVKEKSDS